MAWSYRTDTCENAMGSKWNGLTRHLNIPTLFVSTLIRPANGWKSNQVDIRRYREERP